VKQTKKMKKNCANHAAATDCNHIPSELECAIDERRHKTNCKQHGKMTAFSARPGHGSFPDRFTPIRK
ncbi:MAG: hypothetical protein QME68_05650, partial [Elusimicrobiota bacterium]|nr:hypothetical protein [Elusimicrobiota bacterium]